MTRIAWLLGVCFGLAACGEGPAPAKRNGPMEPPAFWVWHRSSGLDADELVNLREAGTRMLAWQVAEAGWAEGGWQLARIAEELPEVEGVKVVPAFRLKPSAEFLGFPDSPAALAQQIRNWNGGVQPPAEIQLDFDCPDSLLTDYAGFIRGLRKSLGPVRISVTALAGWPRVVGFRPLCEAVDELAPMFYDLLPDDPQAVADGKFEPMAGERAVRWIEAWAGCPVPWRAGLPNFERVSIFTADGKLVGHLRGWSHDEVFFHRALAPVSSRDGTTVYAADAEGELAGSKITPGQQIVHRRPTEKILRQLASSADAAGATSVIYFSLPGPGLVTTFGVRHLAAPPDAPRLVVSRGADGVLLLRNAGPIDLPARAVDPADLSARGWRMVVESDSTGAFRSASPGGFVLSDPGGVPAELAGELAFSFSRLGSGESIASGPVLAGNNRLRWRLAGTDFQGDVE